MLNNNLLWSTIISGCILLGGCVSTKEGKNSEFTQGNVQLSVKVNKTTKADILEAFGSPNITTRDGSGKEVWTYQRSAQVAKSSTVSGGAGFLVTLFSGGNFGAAGSASRMSSSSRMMTLIIKFNEKDVVVDFNSRTSNF